MQGVPFRVVVVAVVTVVGGTMTDPVLGVPGCLMPPVEAPVSDPFRAPECEWCPGNRGIEYATATGVPVRAAAAGVVTFAGEVAGTTYVVIRHADGRRATYGQVDSSLNVGAAVPADSVVGFTNGAPFYFGLRDGEVYIDPTPLLGVVERRPRLVPLDGTSPRPPPRPRLTCPAAS